VNSSDVSVLRNYGTVALCNLYIRKKNTQKKKPERKNCC